MGKGYRQGRLGEEIRRIISQMLLSGIKDPRLSGMISISAVDVTSDGSYATRYVSILGSGETAILPMRKRSRFLRASAASKALLSAKSVIR